MEPTFQLTTSRRGRQVTDTKYLDKKDFQLTTSRRGRHDWDAWIDEYVSFQLTTSRRGRPYRVDARPPDMAFNSRPHEEVD